MRNDTRLSPPSNLYVYNCDSPTQKSKISLSCGTQKNGNPVYWMLLSNQNFDGINDNSHSCQGYIVTTVCTPAVEGEVYLGGQRRGASCNTLKRTGHKIYSERLQSHLLPNFSGVLRHGRSGQDLTKYASPLLCGCYVIECIIFQIKPCNLYPEGIKYR